METTSAKGVFQMAELLATIGRLAIGFMSMLGPVVLLFAYLNARDQRASLLSGIVLAELNRPHLRGLYTVRTKTRPLGADALVIDLWNCSREQVRQIVERLSTKVPPRVRAEVNGISGCRVEFSAEKNGMFHQYCTIS
jgi:hypothetical protein